MINPGLTGRITTTAFLLVLACAQMAPAADEPSAFSFTLSDVKLDLDGTHALVELHGEHLSDEQMKAQPPALTDSGKDPSVTFVAQGERPPGQKARTWVYQATVGSLLPPSSTQIREAILKIAGSHDAWSLRYNLTNKPAAPPVLTSASGNGVWAIRWDQSTEPRYQILVSATGAPVHHVRLALSGIKNPKMGSAIDDLALCDDSPKPECGEFEISPGLSRTLYLQLKSRSLDGPYGTFSGDVKFIGDGLDAPVALSVDVTATSALRRGIGLVFLAAGVLLSLLLIVGIRARILRLQAEVPVVALRETIGKTIEAISKLPPVQNVDYTPVANRLRQQLDGISGSALQALLPPRVLPAIPGTSSDNSAGLKNLLETTGHVIAAINILVTQGMQTVAAQFPANPPSTPALATAVQTALRSLIGVAQTVTSESDAAQQLTRILADFDKGKLPVAPQAMSLDAKQVFDALLKSPAAPELLPRTVHQLQYALDSFSMVVWLIWAVVTIGLGYVVMIATSPGFGTWMDIIYCGAWGLGINVAGDVAKSLTPGSISTGLGITLPKVG